MPRSTRTRSSGRPELDARSRVTSPSSSSACSSLSPPFSAFSFPLYPASLVGAPALVSLACGNVFRGWLGTPNRSSGSGNTLLSESDCSGGCVYCSHFNVRGRSCLPLFLLPLRGVFRYKEDPTTSQSGLGIDRLCLLLRLRPRLVRGLQSLSFRVSGLRRRVSGFFLKLRAGDRSFGCYARR